MTYKMIYIKFPTSVGNFFYTSSILPMDLQHKILYHNFIVFTKYGKFLEKVLLFVGKMSDIKYVNGCRTLWLAYR